MTVLPRFINSVNVHLQCHQDFSWWYRAAGCGCAARYGEDRIGYRVGTQEQALPEPPAPPSLDDVRFHHRTSFIRMAVVVKIALLHASAPDVIGR